MYIDWPAIVFSEQTQGRIRSLCERRFGHSADPEVASDYVLEHLSANDWQQCRKFTGKSRPENFLYTLCSNLVEEYARKKFGRIRPPAWLQQLGDTWLTLWKWIYLERQPAPVAIKRLAGRQDALYFTSRFRKLGGILARGTKNMIGLLDYSGNAPVPVSLSLPRKSLRRKVT